MEVLMVDTDVGSAELNQIPILMENLREALRLSHQYIVTGYVASLLALSMSIGHTQTGSQPVQFPGVTVSVPLLFVLLFALGVAWSVGSICFVTMARAHDLAYAVRNLDVQTVPHIDKDVAELALTYPSIFTTELTMLRRTVAILPGIMSSIAAIFYNGSVGLFYWVPLLLLPYIGLLAVSWRGLRER
jgi:hypothetical protein